MNKLGRLIKNELLKKYKQKSTIVLSLVFIILALGIPTLSSVNFSNYDYRSIDNQIEGLEYELEEAKNLDDNEFGVRQREEVLEVYKKARELGVLDTEDWRYNIVTELIYNVSGKYEVEIILDGKFDPIENDNYEKSPMYGYGLANASGLIGVEKPSDEQLNEMLAEYQTKIDGYWKVIETNDYLYLYKKEQAQNELKKASYESQFNELDQIESLTEEQKQELFYLETEMEYLDAQIEINNYCIDNSIDPNSWQFETLQEIQGNSYYISSYKKSIYDLENGFNTGEGNYYGYINEELDLEEKIELDRKQLEYYENNNLICWKSLENGTPTIKIANSSRSFSVSYFSMTMFAAIIALFIASNIVSGEFSTKTINMLVIRPVKRWKIITAKYFTSLVTSYVIYLVGMVLYIIANGIKFGFSDFANPYIYVSGGTAHTVNFFLYMLGQAMFCSVTIVFMVTISFMMSTLTKNTALAGITSMGVYIGGEIILSILIYTVENSIKVLKYTFLPYIDLSRYVESFVQPGYNSNSYFMPNYGAVHLLVLSVAMFAVSIIVFNKRDIKM